ncbi:glycosyltransferase [Alkalihalobacillus sp. NPDC078783]
MGPSNVSIVIPAYEPDQKLVTTIKNILQYNFAEIIVVNDGSSPAKSAIFKTIEKLQRCTVLNHDVNKGKGRALKTAFSYFMTSKSKGIGVVTADADGQHSGRDIQKVAMHLEKHPTDLILGVRNFDEDNIPARSRFGNKVTKSVLKFTAGMKISDTQTGLRGIPATFLNDLLKVTGERYEYEMQMILACRSFKRNIQEVSIDTIYIDENESSHFNPIIDSIKIYYVFLRFAIISVFSFLIDIGLFALFGLILRPLLPTSFVIVATVGSRVLSSIFNFVLNRKMVFRTDTKTFPSAVRYYSLAVVQMSLSAGFVFLIFHYTSGNAVIIKMVVDSLLFVASFFVQRIWVFASKGPEHARNVA